MGVSLTRDDADAERLRRRMELPAEVGRYVLVMLGAVIAAAASGLWITRPSVLADGLLVFGALLILLGVVQHLLLKRDRAHWPDQAYLWADGLELVLHNGEIRATSWTDPKLALDIYLRPLRGVPNEEILLVWKSDAHVPPCQLSVEGFERIRETAIAHGLEFAEFRDGNRKRSMRAYEIRSARSQATSSSSPARPSPSDP
jgi:hypothetical protein